MKQPLLHRATAWLCLALVLLVGATSASGFVVCFEADGCVSVELKAADSTCGGCEGHGEEESEPAEAPSATSALPCPCVDLAVPGSEERVATTRQATVHVGPWMHSAADVRVAPLARSAILLRGPPDSAPRVADAWAQIRSVVLLV